MAQGLHMIKMTLNGGEHEMGGRVGVGAGE